VLEEVIKELQTEMGRKGGKKTLKKHGKKHFSAISRAYWNNKKSGDKSSLRNQAVGLK